MYDDNSYGANSYSNYDFNSNGAGNNNFSNQTPPPFPNTTPEKPKKEKKHTKAGAFFKKAVVCLVLGALFGASAGGAFYGFNQITGTNTKTVASGTAISSEVTDPAVSTTTTDAKTTETQSSTEVSKLIETDITDVVDSVMPAMVAVTNKSTVSYNYFGRVYSEEQEGAGSGIIVGQNDSELLIVTNYHVIEDADTLEVTFIDDSVSSASVKGTDKTMDLAVIAVNLSDMSTDTLNSIVIATLGDSDALTLGEPVVAIGNALGYGQSVTNGIVSALNREIETSDGNTGTFIQTNAAINPGNSGGALLNYNGEVIGINSNKIGGTTIEGMGYAIPISSAKPIIAELMLKSTKTKVTSEGDIGYIGIRPAEVSEGMPSGVYVVEVYESTPAEEAGLRTGDIITSIDGEEVTCYSDLQKALTYLPGGTTVDITVSRYGASGFEDMTFTLTLGSRSDITTEN